MGDSLNSWIGTDGKEIIQVFGQGLGVRRRIA